jgi:hypothetical protein
VRASILAALMFVGCLPTEPVAVSSCTSLCGSELYYGDDCSGFRAAEQYMLTAFARHFDSDPEKLCRKLDGTSVWIWGDGQEPTFVDPWGRPGISGFAHCASRSVTIATLDWRNNAYVHEMIHLLLECPLENDEHVGWKTGPHYAAIADAQTHIFPEVK